MNNQKNKDGALTTGHFFKYTFLFLHCVHLSAVFTLYMHFVVVQLQTISVSLNNLLAPFYTVQYSQHPQDHHRAGIIWVVARSQRRIVTDMVCCDVFTLELFSSNSGPLTL